eukprot:2934138-Pyramimonas_sp.AAC.1
MWLARRMLDATHASASPGLLAIFLDWANAFDIIMQYIRIETLGRFGIPERMVEFIPGKYGEAYVVLKYDDGKPTRRRQRAGIAQGCPLFPYVLKIVQSAMFFYTGSYMRDRGHTVEEPPYVVCSDLVYADDTMLASSNTETNPHVTRLRRRRRCTLRLGTNMGLCRCWWYTP